MAAISGAFSAANRVRPQVWAIVGALVITCALAALAIFLFTPKSGAAGALSPYDQQAIAILGQQSELNTEWNSLLDDLNAPVPATQDAYMESFNASLVKARSIVNDSQAIIIKWRKLQPPPDAENSHSLALQAMTATQSGFIALQEYLEQAASSGVSDTTLLEQSQARIDEASGLWEQARQADTAIAP